MIAPASFPTIQPRIRIEVIASTTDGDLSIKAGDSVGHHAHLSWKTLDTALAEGSFAALNELLFEIWASEFAAPPSLMTLAEIHHQAHDILAANQEVA